MSMLPITVEPTRILIGSDWVPRFLDLPRVLQVLPGQEFTLPADGEWDYIEVGGTLHVSRDHDTTVRFTHFFILPDGQLDCGTEDNPMPRRVEFIGNDVPLDTTRDISMWGNSLLNFGRQDRCGIPKLPFGTATGSLAAGATTVTLNESPVGWNVGDEVLVLDTRSPWQDDPLQRESPATVTAIAGMSLILSKGLDFAHDNIIDPDGVVVLTPRVVNLTRNISIRSANPNGTPIHHADVGHMAMRCVCYNEFIGVGRTKADRIDNSNRNTGHVGLNQIARYNDHQHHAMGFGSMTIGNVYLGNAASGKWGISVHGTHDTRVEGNIALDFRGSGFVTEDGYETRNIFRKNLAAYCYQGSDGINSAQNVVDHNNPGSEGAGFWWRGINGTYLDNESWNNTIGQNLFNQNQIQGNYPSQVGGPEDTPFNRLLVTPDFQRTIAASNMNSGVEYWGTPRFPGMDITAAYNGSAQFAMVISNPADPYLVTPTLIGKDGTTVGITSGIGYAFNFEVAGGQISGCRLALSGGGGFTLTKFSQTRFNQNLEGLDWSSQPRASLLDSVQFTPRPGQEPRYIIFSKGIVWDGMGPLPDVGISNWRKQQGSQHKILNWNGTGHDYQVFDPQQMADTTAWPSGPGLHVFNDPDANMTMGQSWQVYGLAFGGEALNPAAVVPLEGLVIGKARSGVTSSLGSPHAVMTFPTARESAIFGPGDVPFIWCSSVLTGDGTGMSRDILISVDGGPEHLADLREQGEDAYNFALQGADVSVGTHEVRTWRTLTDGAKADASLLVFHYVIGAVEVPVTVPNVVGLQQPAAVTTLTASGLIVGTVTTQANPASTGQVISQLPVAGAHVPAHSAVNLVVSSGPAMVTVPNVVGQMQTAAQATLTAAGLTSIVTMQTDAAAKGTVLTQMPTAGTTVASGSAVGLIVSDGPAMDVWTNAQAQTSNTGKARLLKPDGTSLELQVKP